MKLLEISDLYNMISKGTESISTRKQTRELRKLAFDSSTTRNGFEKIAFDTRRIDQETEFNPRRGLQNYTRSEAFITEAMSQKIINFAKLRKVLGGLKEIYGKDPEWQDSNARVLLSTIDNGLRTSLKDGDYTDNQPGLGSFDYLEELLHVRYRLSFDNLTALGETDLQKVILSKDEELTHKAPKETLEITKSDVGKFGYDALIDKLFDGCRASEDNPDVERTITITIRDKFNKEG